MKLSNIVSTLVEWKIIEEEDAELVHYGLKQGFFYLLNILLTLFIGIVFCEIIPSICFLVCFIVLRSYVGGYHARTVLRCFGISVFLMIMVIGSIHFMDWSAWISALILCVSFVILWKISPVDNEKRILTVMEQNAYKKISHYLLLVEILAATLCCCLGWHNLLEAITMALLITCVLAVMGKVMNS